MVFFIKGYLTWLDLTWYLLYATECLGLTARQMRSLHNTWQCAVSHISNVHGTKFYLYYYWQCIPDTVIAARRIKFLQSLQNVHGQHPVLHYLYARSWALLVENSWLKCDFCLIFYCLCCMFWSVFFFFLFYFLSRGISTVCLLPYGE